MIEPQRTCPQCHDYPMDHRFNGEIPFENVEETTKVGTDRKVDCLYLAVKVYACPACGHLEFVERDYKEPEPLELKGLNDYLEGKGKQQIGLEVPAVTHQ